MRAIKRNVMTSVLVLCGLVTPTALLACAFATGPVAWALFGLACFPVLIAGAGFVYFGLKDPDRLQTEEYRIQDKALDIIESKAEGVAVDSVDLTVMFNTEVQERKALPPKSIDVVPAPNNEKAVVEQKGRS